MTCCFIVCRNCHGFHTALILVSHRIHFVEDCGKSYALIRADVAQCDVQLDDSAERFHNENNCIVCKGDNSFEIEEINLSDVIGKAVLFEHDEIKRRILRPSNYFIKTDIMVNKIYKRFNNSIRYTIKSDIYNEYLKERDILFKKHILSLD